MKFIVIGGGCYGIYHSGQLFKAIVKGKLPTDTQLVIVDRHARPAALTAHANKPGFSFVQSDWQAFLQSFFSDPAQFDPARDGDAVQIVPAPFAPHLLFDWLHHATISRLQELNIHNITVTREGFDYQMDLPFESTDKDGNHYISRAGWLCPTTCIEPRICPAVKGVRDWDLDTDVRNFVAGQPVLASVSAAPKLLAANLANGQQVAVRERSINPGEFGGVETFTCHHFAHGIGTVPARRLFEARAHLLEAALALNPTRPVTRFAIATVSHCHGVVATLRLEHSH